MKKKQDPESELTPNPVPKQACRDDADFYLNALEVIFAALWSMTLLVLKPLWALLRFIVYDAWQTPPEAPKKK